MKIELSKSASPYKSMGMQIKASGIEMLQRSNGTESPVTINDLVNANGSAAGTELMLRIPLMQ